jgi:hypothetical protein
VQRAETLAGAAVLIVCFSVQFALGHLGQFVDIHRRIFFCKLECTAPIHVRFWDENLSSISRMRFAVRWRNCRARAAWTGEGARPHTITIKSGGQEYPPYTN